MAIIDIKSNLTTVYSDLIDLTAGSVEVSTQLNLENYDNGVMLIPIFNASNETDSFSIEAIEHSTNALNWEDVLDEQYIGDFDNFQNLTNQTPALIVSTLGIFGNRRYVRARVNANAANTANVSVQLIWIISANILTDVNSQEILPNNEDDLVTNDGLLMLTNDDLQMVVEV